MVLNLFGEVESDIYNEDKSQMKLRHREFDTCLNNSIFVDITFYPHNTITLFANIKLNSTIDPF